MDSRYRVRTRASTSNVAPESYRLEVHEVELFRFATRRQCVWAKRKLLISILRPGDGRAPYIVAADEKRLIRELWSLATHYQDANSLPHPSRSEARAQLIHLSDLALNQKNLGAPDISKLSRLLSEPNDLARSSLWSALTDLGLRTGSLPIYVWLHSEHIDWPLVARAASRAATWLRGGDYPDLALTSTIGGLVDCQEWYSGRQATMGKAGSEPSSTCRFIREFFGLVDPSLELGTIDGMIDRTLRGRRKRLGRRYAIASVPPWSIFSTEFLGT